jgi:hypothetical protein
MLRVLNWRQPQLRRQRWEKRWLLLRPPIHEALPAEHRKNRLDRVGRDRKPSARSQMTPFAQRRSAGRRARRRARLPRLALKCQTKKWRHRRLKRRRRHPRHHRRLKERRRHLQHHRRLKERRQHLRHRKTRCPRRKVHARHHQSRANVLCPQHRTNQQINDKIRR